MAQITSSEDMAALMAFLPRQKVADFEEFTGVPASDWLDRCNVFFIKTDDVAPGSYLLSVSRKQ